MAYLSIGLRALLVVVFAAAALGKLRSRSAFGGLITTLRQFGLPHAAARLASVALIVGETLIAVLLVWPEYAVVGAALAAGLCAIYLIAVAWAILRRSSAECSCFGAAGGRFRGRHAVRNGLLLALAVAAIATGATGPITVAPLAVVCALTGVVAAAAFVYWDNLAATVLGAERLPI